MTSGIRLLDDQLRWREGSPANFRDGDRFGYRARFHDSDRFHYMSRADRIRSVIV